MKAKEIIKILNNKEFDKNGKLCFYMKDGDKEIYLDIESINYFGISSDIPIELTKIELNSYSDTNFGKYKLTINESHVHFYTDSSYHVGDIIK